MSKRREQKQDGQQALEHSKPAEAGAPGLRLSEAWIAGPTLLATIASVESMIWLWRTYWKRAPDPEMLKRYTSIALQLFQLDYDRPIYLGGALFCILLALTVCFLWTRRLRSSNGESPQFVRVVLFAHFPVAAAIILLPMLWMRSPTLNLLAAVFGFLFLVAAYVCDDRLAGLAHGLEKFTQAYGSVVAAVLAAVIVIEFVGVSRLAELSGRTFLLDTYQHWDFYVMGPALAYRHGMALGTDFYTQYGVAWPIVLAWLSQGTALSYHLALEMATTWGCVYYIALYLFLRYLLGRASWAFLGLFLTLAIQGFGGMMGSHLWALPQGTVMRYSIDIFFFSACLFHARSGKAWFGPVLGGITGLALLFSTDIGLYIVVCLFLYLAAVPRMAASRCSRRGMVVLTASALAGFLVVLLGGLAIASRGTLLTRKFWTGWLEGVISYGGGISDLPIAATMTTWGNYVLLTLLLGFYLGTLAASFIKWLTRRMSAEDVVLALVAAYGMATLLLFIGRSDPVYMNNVSVPACILATSVVARLYQNVVRYVQTHDAPPQPAVDMSLRMFPAAAAFAVLTALCANPAFQQYPGRYQSYMLGVPPEVLTDNRNYLFESRHDALLPKEADGFITQFRAVTSLLKKLTADGHTKVAMIDLRETSYLVEADIAPRYRYCPLIASLLTKELLNGLIQEILANPPDYIVCPHESPRTLFNTTADDIYLPVLSAIRQRYSLEQQVYGMDLWKLQPQAGGNLEPAVPVRPRG
jgi:hypothetical protein